MSRVFTMTTADAVDGAIAACSGISVTSGTSRSCEVVEGGATEAVNRAYQVPGSATNTACVFYESATGQPNDTTWEAGNWTVRLNNQSANASVDWVSLYICRLNSAGVNQETVASATGLAIDLSTTGVKSQTISQGSPVTAAAGDRFYIVLGFDNSNSCQQTLNLHKDQNIDTPITAGGGGGGSDVLDPFGASGFFGQ